VQAHTLGEVGNLGTVSLRVSSGTILPTFIEIGSYLTDKEQKINWHSFLRHGVFSVAKCLVVVLPPYENEISKISFVLRVTGSGANFSEFAHLRGASCRRCQPG